MLKYIRRRIKLDGELVCLTEFHQFLLFERFAETGADDAVADVQVEAAGEVGTRRVDVDQLGGEIGIDG